MLRKAIQVGIVAWTGFAVAALAAGKPEFSADMVMQSSGQTVSGKVFVSNERIRTEMPQAVSITKLDQMKTIILMPDQKMYMEHPLDRLAAVKAGVEAKGQVERASMGKENVSGRDTEKFRVTTTDEKGSTTTFQWIDAQGIPVKVADESGSWSVEYQNVKTGPQADSLFEAPSDYQKMEMPVMPNMAALMKQAADGGEGQN